MNYAADAVEGLRSASSGGTNPSYDTTTVRSGVYALKVQPTSAKTCLFQTRASLGSYNRVYIRVTALPATTARGLLGSKATGVGILLNPDGTLELNNGGTVIGTSTTALTDTAHWYRVEWRLANGSSVPVLVIDGVTEITDSPSSWSMSAYFGTPDTVADTYTAYFDDYTADDTGFPGDGKAVLLLPVADDTVTNWTAGSGGTSNLYEAVNNTPPTGTNSETDTTNIKTTNTSSPTYIATMASYAAAGLTASDTVNMVMQLVCHGEHAATGSKTGSYELTANPVVSSTSFTFGDNDGAHAEYDGLSSTKKWRVAQKITTSPSVTVDTAPTMKVVRTGTGSGQVCICFMGLYVEYASSPNGTLTASVAEVSAVSLTANIDTVARLTAATAAADGGAPSGVVTTASALVASEASAASAASADAGIDITTRLTASAVTGAAASPDAAVSTTSVFEAGVTAASGALYAAALVTSTALAASAAAADGGAPSGVVTTASVFEAGATAASGASEAGTLSVHHTLTASSVVANAGVSGATYATASVVLAALASVEVSALAGAYGATALFGAGTSAGTAATHAATLTASAVLVAVGAAVSVASVFGAMMSTASVLAVPVATGVGSGPNGTLFVTYVATLTLADAPLTLLTLADAPLTLLTLADAPLTLLTLAVNP